jgi:hypothetical protein
LLLITKIMQIFQRTLFPNVVLFSFALFIIYLRSFLA